MFNLKAMSNLLLTVPMLCLSAPVWKFNIGSNDHGRTHSFWLEIPFLGKCDQKSQNCQFKLKFGTQTNSNMQN